MVEIESQVAGIRTDRQDWQVPHRKKRFPPAFNYAERNIKRLPILLRRVEKPKGVHEAKLL